jgi:cysteine-rich CPCC protein
MAEYETSTLHYPCPGCGFLTLEEPSGRYEICAICGWEDDHVQIRFPLLRGGANRECLVEHQQDWVKWLPLSVQEHRGFRRDSSWRPVRPDECQEPGEMPQTRLQHFHEAVEDSPTYYWRKDADGDDL